MPEAARRPNGEVNEELDRFFIWCEKYKMPINTDSLIEWDRAENKKRLLNYDREYCYRLGLRAQADQILSTYTRVRVMISGEEINFPTLLSTGKNTLTKVAEMTTQQLKVQIDSFQEYIRRKGLRLVLMGAGVKAVRNAINDALSDIENGADE